MWKSAQVITERAHRNDSEKYSNQEMSFTQNIGGHKGSQLHKMGQSMGLDWALLLTNSTSSGSSHQFD